MIAKIVKQIHLSTMFYFVGHRQTVQTQIRHHRTLRMVRLSSVCLREFQFKLKYKCNIKSDGLFLLMTCPRSIAKIVLTDSVDPSGLELCME